MKKGRLLPIRCVIIHATKTGNIESPLGWLCDPKSQASAHFLIGRDGRVIQLVDEADTSWHAGLSTWRGMEYVNPKSGNPTVNPCSIGVELVNLNDGKDPYPKAQFDVLVELVSGACIRHGVAIEDVIGHEDVAPGRKTDPGPMFNWTEFRARLYSLGVA